MLNKQLQTIAKGLNAVGNLKGVKFAYAVAKNKVLVDRELEILQTAINPNEKFKKYEEERIKLCEVFAEKDEKDKPKMENNEYIITDRVKFDKELDKLQKELSAVVAERDAQVKEFNELLNKESDFKPFMIEYEDVPTDITSDSMSLIVDLINPPK